ESFRAQRNDLQRGSFRGAKGPGVFAVAVVEKVGGGRNCGPGEPPRIAEFVTWSTSSFVWRRGTHPQKGRKRRVAAAVEKHQAILFGASFRDLATGGYRQPV